MYLNGFCDLCVGEGIWPYLFCCVVKHLDLVDVVCVRAVSVMFLA